MCQFSMGWILATDATCQAIARYLLSSYDMQGVTPSVLGGGQVRKGFEVGPQSSRRLVTELQKSDTHAPRVAVRKL